VTRRYRGECDACGYRGCPSCWVQPDDYEEPFYEVAVSHPPYSAGQPYGDGSPEYEGDAA
jgi:hypothetical protein